MVKASIYSQISTNKRNSYLLFLFFFAIMFALGWLISSVWGLGNIGIVLIGLVSIIWMLISYYKGDSVVLAANGAREVSKRDEPYLVNLVEGLALASGIPTPKIYVVEDGGGNRDKGSGWLIVIGILAAILAPIFAQLVQLAISRQREYLADSSGALITHNPQGLADALKKIASDKTPARQADKTSASLYIANPFKKVDVAGLFSTHPPIKERIAKLEEI